MARIENHMYSIADAFRECFYVVPDYQREYVWQDKQVEQLLEDLDEQVDLGVDREYFIGTVLVAPYGKDDTLRNRFDVIDGQQRLTTLFLLLCALRNQFKGTPQAQMLNELIASKSLDGDGNVVRSLKLVPRYESASDLINQIVELDTDPQGLRTAVQASGIPSFGSLENLLNAYQVVYQYLRDNYSAPEQLRRYLSFLGRNVVFIQISTDVSRALKIFETINERGVGLNPMDLLKNLLFTHVRQDQFTQLKDEWKKITKPLERAQEKPLRFLRYLLMANYVIRNERGDSVVREDEIYDWFTNKDNAALCDYSNKPFEFVRRVVRNVEHYLAFSNGLGNDGKPSIAMDSLRRLTGAAFSLHYVLLLAAANFPKALFDHFVVQLESFLFFYIFTKSATKDLERNFSSWADELRNIGSMAESQKQSSALNAFVSENFQKNMTSKVPELEDALKRYTLHSMQQYRTRYLLARVTQHVDMAFSGVKSPATLEPYMRLEIEHILPNQPTTELSNRWATEHPDAAYGDYKNRLGNLTLLEKPINIVASNDFYINKVPEYRKSGNYLTRSLAELSAVGNNSSINRINAKLEAFPVWNAEAIDRRQQILIALIKDIWRTTPAG